MQRRPYLVGVAGGSGSGKTSLVRAVRDRMPAGAVCIISQDDYYLPIEVQAVDPNGKVNFDLPSGVDLNALVNDLRTLGRGGSILRTEYNFNQTGQAALLMEIRPAPVVLVEGLFVLHHVELRELFDLRVYVDASEQTQLDRRLRRDSKERGYGHEEVLYQWEHHVLPAYRDFLLPYRHLCDLHVVNEQSFDRAVPVLCAHLQGQASSTVEPVLADVGEHRR